MTRPDTLLLVDDTRSDALLYSGLLRARQPHRRVDHAATLEAAMAMLGQEPYSAVLLDLGLPDSRDLEGLERILARHPDMTVVVLTGREDADLGERAIAAGAQDYLHKSEAGPGALDRALRHARARQRLENEAREAADERRRTEQALRDKTAELEAVNDAAPLGLVRLDAEGRGIYFNRTWERLAGLPAAQALGDGWLQAVHPDDRARLAGDWARTVGDGGRLVSQLRFLHADGRRVWVKAHTSPMVIDGKVAGYYATVQDFTREREAESARRRGERRLATLADALPLLLMFLDRDLRVEFINSGWTRELRRPAGEILGRPVLELISEPGASHFAEGLEIALRGVEHNVEFDDPDETVIRTWATTFIPQTDQAGAVDGIHVMLRDVTLDKAHRQDLVRRAEQDPLTGVLNRAGFERYGGQAWSEAARQGRSLGVFFFDLDGFKEINDSLGHAAGDGLLQEVAARVGDCTRADDLVARLGGDEFAIVARHVSGADAARRLADKLIAAVAAASLQPKPGAPPLHASCSIGYCIADPARLTLPQALKRADEALYAVKRAGKGRAAGWYGSTPASDSLPPP